MVFLDGTVVNVALPRIGEELPTSIVSVLEGQTYVVAGYMATLSALLVLAGALGDQAQAIDRALKFAPSISIAAAASDFSSARVDEARAPLPRRFPGSRR